MHVVHTIRAEVDRLSLTLHARSAKYHEHHRLLWRITVVQGAALKLYCIAQHTWITDTEEELFTWCGDKIASSGIMDQLLLLSETPNSPVRLFSVPAWCGVTALVPLPPQRESRVRF